MGVPADHSHLGDPVGMERLAAELLQRAESLTGIVDGLARRVETMTFEGPAAARLRDEMQSRRRRANALAVELQAGAHALRRAASAVREQIHEAQLRGLERDPE